MPSTSPYPSYTLSRHSREQSLRSTSPTPVPFQPAPEPTLKQAASEYQHRRRPSSPASASSQSSVASFRLRQKHVEKTLSQVALEVEGDERRKSTERGRKVWRWLAWLSVAVMEGWVGYCAVRYLIAFILMDPSVQRSLNLTFFITSLISILTLPLLFLTPWPFNILFLTLSSLLTLLTAASQVAVYKSWENEQAPTGFANRCGWNMDASWGRGTVCDGWSWDGWLGVLCARLAGSFVVLSLISLAYVRAARPIPDAPLRLPSSPTIPYFNGNHHRSTSSHSFVPPSHEPKPPPTTLDRTGTKVYDYYTPALWSAENRPARVEKREREMEELKWQAEREDMLRLARKEAQRAALAFSTTFGVPKDSADRPRTISGASTTAYGGDGSQRNSYLGPLSVTGSSGGRITSPYLRSTLPASPTIEEDMVAFGSTLPAVQAQPPMVVIRSPSTPDVPDAGSSRPIVDSQIANVLHTPQVLIRRDFITPETSPNDSEHSPISPPWTTPAFPLPPPSVGGSRTSMISHLTYSSDEDDQPADVPPTGGGLLRQGSLRSRASSNARSSIIESLTGSDLGNGSVVLDSRNATFNDAASDKQRRRWSGTPLTTRKPVSYDVDVEAGEGGYEVNLASPTGSDRSASPPTSSRPTSSFAVLSRTYTLTADPPLDQSAADLDELDPLEPSPTLLTPSKPRMSRPKSLSPTYQISSSGSSDDEPFDVESDTISAADVPLVIPPRRNAHPSRLHEHRLSTVWSGSEGSLASKFEAHRRGSETTLAGGAGGEGRRSSEYSTLADQRRGSQSRRGSEGADRRPSFAEDIVEEEGSP